MKLNRRNTLIGLGTIVAGGGAALGTGAFSSVEADRTVSVGTEADSSALLALTDEDASDYITEEDGTLEIDVSNINYDARTFLGEIDSPDDYSSAEVTTAAIGITNNGTNTVNIDVNFDYANSETPTQNAEDVLKFVADVSGASGSISGEDVGNISENTLEGLEANQSADVIVEFDTRGIDETDIDESEDLFDEVTITAESQ